VKKQPPSLPPSPDASPAAYSYVRFSSPEQAEGDSLRRQTEATEAWCAGNGVRLDTSLTLRDLGVSAFKGAHRTGDKHHLALFLKLAEKGRIPPGSFLVIENLDRLSREDERTALRLWMDILDQKINIVQLHPETVFRHDESDMMDIMRAIIELSRGHSESAIKSARLGAAWDQKRKEAREGGKALTRRLPAWVEERGGKLELIPTRAAAVKRIFNLAAAGYGHVLIVKRLRDEKVPAFGVYVVHKGRKRSAFSGDWTRSYVALLLRDRRATGELQMRRQDGTPDGEPIPDYYPAVVTEAEWLAARAGAAQRERRPGRTSARVVNLFAGLLWDARSGEPYYAATRKAPGGFLYRILFNKTAHAGRAPYYSFSAVTFEAAILSLLAEVDPREVLGEEDGPDEVMVLSGEKAQIESRIAELEAELLRGDVAALAKVLRQLEARNRDLASKLAEARQQAAHPLSESWGECKSLLTALGNAPDPADARLRLRAALRRVVEGIWLLIVPRGRDRLAVAQAWFTGAGCRSYAILHRPPKANGAARQEGQWWARSFTDVAPGEFDLRDPGQARQLETVLADVPLDEPDRV
jgi:DNA invertase Pin-like site-specific DNA recombinase